MNAEEATERSKDETVLSQLRQINELEGKLREAELKSRMDAADRYNMEIALRNVMTLNDRLLNIIEALSNVRILRK